MRKVLSFVLAVMLVMAMAVPAFAAPSAVASVTSASKTASLPVVSNKQAKNLVLVPWEEAEKLSDAAQETYAKAYEDLKNVAPEGMAVQYFFYVLTNGAESDSVSLKVDGVKEVVAKIFRDGKWVDLKCTLNADGTVTIVGLVDGPLAIFTK